MKKLLIKVISVIAIIVVLMGICVACDNNVITKVTEAPTIGVINITATEETRIAPTVKPTVKPTETPTIKPTEKPTEISTEPPTEVITQAEIETTASNNYSYTEDLVDISYTSYPLTVAAVNSNSNSLYDASDFQSAGVVDWNDWTWTYYSSQILPGYGLYIPGRYEDENGYICDENGYICLASSSLDWGTVVDTPFGKQGRVYDTGCASDVLDVYVNW